MRVRIVLFCSVALLATLQAQSDWPVYGGDPGNDRYSSLSQISPSRSGNLRTMGDKFDLQDTDEKSLYTAERTGRTLRDTPTQTEKAPHRTATQF